MKKALLVYGLSAVIASSLMLLPSPSSAKTVKACEEEWKANKSTIQASGKKKKDFMTECRAETASTEPALPPTAQPAPAEQPKSTTAAPRARVAKTIKACAAEWTANKATIQASGKTRKDFIAECRAGTTTAAAPATAPRPAPAEERKSEATAPPPPASTMPTAAGEFRTEAEAKAHCPGDTVVWAKDAPNNNRYEFGMSLGLMV